MANAVVLWVIVYFCVTLVNTKDNIDICLVYSVMVVNSSWIDPAKSRV